MKLISYYRFQWLWTYRISYVKLQLNFHWNGFTQYAMRYLNIALRYNVCKFRYSIQGCQQQNAKFRGKYPKPTRWTQNRRQTYSPLPFFLCKNQVFIWQDRHLTLKIMNNVQNTLKSFKYILFTQLHYCGRNHTLDLKWALVAWK